MAKKNSLLPTNTNDSFPNVPQSRKGWFEQGTDKLGRPYEKKLDENGLFTKAEILKDGTRKLTIKKKP